MGFWPVHEIAGGSEILADLAAWEPFARSYLPFFALSVVLIALLIKGYNVWQEIHDVEESVSDGELLEAFEQAHAEGELDEEELGRIRLQLQPDPGAAGNAGPKPPAVKPQPAVDRIGVESERAPGAGAKASGP